MAVYKQKVQKPSSYSVQKAGGLRCSLLYHGIPKEVDSNSSERMADKERTSFFMSCPLLRLPKKGVSHNKGESSHLKRSGLEVYLPNTKIQIRSGSSDFK